MTCWFVAALITECSRVEGLRRASKLLRLSPRQFPRSSSHLEAPKALGAASWRLQGLWEQLSRRSKGLGAAISRLQRLGEQLSRGSRGSGSGHLDAPEALGAAIARFQRLWEQPSRGSRGSRGPSGSNLSFLEFSRVFSSLETSWGVSQRLLEARGGLPAASSRLKRASRWLRVALRALRSGLEASEAAWSGLKSDPRASDLNGNQREASRVNSNVLSTAASMD